MCMINNLQDFFRRLVVKRIQKKMKSISPPKSNLLKGYFKKKGKIVSLISIFFLRSRSHHSFSFFHFVFR